MAIVDDSFTLLLNDIGRFLSNGESFVAGMSSCHTSALKLKKRIGFILLSLTVHTTQFFFLESNMINCVLPIYDLSLQNSQIKQHKKLQVHNTQKNNQNTKDKKYFLFQLKGK